MIETRCGHPHIDRSYVTTPEKLLILQRAGQAVGVDILQVPEVINACGMKISVGKGEVGVRYSVETMEEFDLFNSIVNILEVKAQKGTSVSGV